MADETGLFGQDVLGDLGSVTAELGRIESLSNGVGRSLANALRGAVTDGKSLQSVLRDVGQSLADIALKAALKPVGDLTASLIEGLFTAANPALGGVTAFAKGGVVASPTYFPMQTGLGLAGEAGAEAILPLTRGPDGSLGVAAASGGGAVTVNFNVTASDARSFAASEAELSAMLLRAVRRGTRAS